MWTLTGDRSLSSPLDQSMSNPQLSLWVRSYTDKESVLSTFDPDYTF